MAETVGARERGRITPDEGAVLAAETARNAEFGKPVLIYPNLYLVRVPLPHNPLHPQLLFHFGRRRHHHHRDVGFNHPDCEQALSDALAALGRSWDKVQVVLTHSHPDHTGNLDRIWREGMPVLANLHSFQEVKNLMEMEGNVYGPLLLQAATSEQQQDMTFGEEGPRLHVSAELLPLSTYPIMTYLADGDCLSLGEFEFEVIETPGHDPWHICLYEAAHKILLSGDHVLERITPSVSSWFSAYNALAEFLDSLEKVRGYDVDLVLPAHGKPFTGMGERVDLLIEHHRKRLEEIYELVAGGHDDIVQISQHATWRYPDWKSWPLDQKYFSMGETLAHLIYLVREGRILQGICGHEYYFRMPYDRKKLALSPTSEPANSA
ncbi:MAG: MBL fold metallo-hydrolase [Adlercreutzia equolifaciens]